MFVLVRGLRSSLNTGTTHDMGETNNYVNTCTNEAGLCGAYGTKSNIIRTSGLAF